MGLRDIDITFKELNFFKSGFIVAFYFKNSNKLF